MGRFMTRQQDEIFEAGGMAPECTVHVVTTGARSVG